MTGDSQNTSGIHRIFSVPWAYDGFQRLIAAENVHRAFVIALDIRPGHRVLDLGCGTGLALDYLPRDLHYTGIDLSAEYIEQAKARRGSRGTFVCRRFDRDFVAEGDGYDRVMALGLLHHLDDASARHVFTFAKHILRPGGLLGTIDPCFTDEQSKLAAFLIRKDRGQSVRRVPEYRALAESAFPRVTTVVHHRLLRIPYTHVIMTCG